MNIGRISGGSPAEFDRTEDAGHAAKGLAPSADHAHAAAAPVFPRSGWEDRGTLLAAQLRAKLGLDRAEGGINWRMVLRHLLAPTIQKRPPTEEPRMQPMYGMAFPGPGVGTRPGGGAHPAPTRPPVDEPRMMPMYGMAFPDPIRGPGAGLPPDPVARPVPEPPRMMPMYGMAFPDPVIGPHPSLLPFPMPPPDPPSMQPMYGMAMPPGLSGSGGGAVPPPRTEPAPPMVMPLYGMIMPRPRDR